MKTLTESDVTFTLEMQEDEFPVRGHCSAHDPETDKATEDSILARLESGDSWAWAIVTVKAVWKSFQGVDTLCGCSYDSEADFTTPGGYYDDMKHVALEDLNRSIRQTADQLDELS